MDTQVFWFLGIAIIALSQALVLAMKLNQGRANRKKTCKPENPGHGERIAKLEEAMENVKENNEKDHRLIRKDIAKLTVRINGLRR